MEWCSYLLVVRFRFKMKTYVLPTPSHFSFCLAEPPIQLSTYVDIRYMGYCEEAREFSAWKASHVSSSHPCFAHFPFTVSRFARSVYKSESSIKAEYNHAYKLQQCNYNNVCHEYERIDSAKYARLPSAPIFRTWRFLAESPISSFYTLNRCTRVVNNSDKSLKRQHTALASNKKIPDLWVESTSVHCTRNYKKRDMRGEDPTLES